MSFQGFTQGSIHQVRSAKLSKGDDWNIEASAYDTGRLKGITENFKLPDVKTIRNKILSAHPYNPQITECPTVTPGKDWDREPSEYETYRPKGMTNDQRFAMPKFKPNTIKTQIQYTENQYNLYHEINPLERAITSIPHIIATASRQENDAAQNAAYYSRIADGEHVDPDQAPGSIDPEGAREKHRRAMNEHVGNRAPMQHRPSVVDGSDVSSLPSMSDVSSLPSMSDDSSTVHSSEFNPSSLGSSSAHSSSSGSSTDYPSSQYTEDSESGYDTPPDHRMTIPRKNLFKIAKEEIIIQIENIERAESNLEAQLSSAKKKPATQQNVDEIMEITEEMNSANGFKRMEQNRLVELTEAEHNEDDKKALELMEPYKREIERKLPMTDTDKKPSLEDMMQTSNPRADRVLEKKPRRRRKGSVASPAAFSSQPGFVIQRRAEHQPEPRRNIQNPQTGRIIKVGGKTYMKLVKSGEIEDIRPRVQRRDSNVTAFPVRPIGDAFPSLAIRDDELNRTLGSPFTVPPGSVQYTPLPTRSSRSSESSGSELNDDDMSHIRQLF